MAAWSIVLVPLLIMFFALGMERVEARLRQVTVSENELEEFLEQARPSEVRALFSSGMSRALELFRLRRRSPHPARHALTARTRTPHRTRAAARPISARQDSVEPRSKAS